MTTGPSLQAVVRETGAEFIDLGAGRGDSLVASMVVSGRRGVGVDIDRNKVARAQARGRPVVEGSILDLPADLEVRFATADNVLEHLASLDEVEVAVAEARRVAREFLVIRHPSFDDEEHLERLHLRRYWTDWHGHRCHALLPDLLGIFERVGAVSWEIRPTRRIVDAADPAILPSVAPPDQQVYDAACHGPKPSIRFERPIYEAYDILVGFTDPVTATFAPPNLATCRVDRPRIVLRDEDVGWPARRRRDLRAAGFLAADKVGGLRARRSS